MYPFYQIQTKKERLGTMSYLMYLRKSRSDDPKETVEQVLAKHERILQNYAFSVLEMEIPDENIYREVVSGETIEDRPEVKKMFLRMQSNEIKGVLVVDCQRLSRGDLIDCGTVLQNFKYTRTLIITPTVTFDLWKEYDYKNVQSELMQGSEYLAYSKKIMQRGTVQSILEGNYLANRVPFGYRKVVDGKKRYLVPDEEKAPFLKLIFKMYLEGNTRSKISNELNRMKVPTLTGSPWCDNTIDGILKNETYTGHTTWNKFKTEKIMIDGKLKKTRIPQTKPIVVKNTHEALVTEEDFKKVQDMLKAKSVKVNLSKELKNPFAGILRCKLCGHTLTYQAAHRNGRSRLECGSKVNCRCISSIYDVVKNEIVKGLKQYIDDFEVEIKQTDEDWYANQKSLIVELQKRKQNLKTKLNNIYDLLESGIYSKQEFVERRSKIESDIIDIDHEIQALKLKTPERQVLIEKSTTLHKAIDMINDDNISALTKNIFLKSFIEVIWYEKINSDTIYNGRGKSKITESENLRLEIVLK